MPTPLTHDDPQALGAYRLIARLGSGGMGTVYLARSPGGRTVALKTMHARIASEPAFRTRFRLESDAARVIGGQFGAQVVDADPLAETPWLATEYVLGPPLDDAVELAGPLAEPSVRALGAALCMALGQLHRSDVVHRDLKPSNIMVTAYGPKVIDFGIARAIGDERLTYTGSAVGTPAFMSPEQATGQEHTPAGDVFALAGVLVFAATGAGPFGYGQAADLLYRVRYQEPELSRVPPALAPVLARCLAKDPAHRPTTSQLAAELHDGDGAFADHLPDAVLADIGRRASEVWQTVPQRLPPPEDETAPAAAPAPAAGRTTRRRMLTLGAGLGGAAALAGAGVWGWREWGRQEEEPAVEAPTQERRNPQWSQSFEHPSRDETEWVTPISVKHTVLVADGGLKGYEAKTGRLKFEADEGAYSWEVAAAGGAVYRMAEFSDDDVSPLALASLLPDGSDKPIARFHDLNGNLNENQVLCAAEGVLYLAAGRGTYSSNNYAGPDWTLQAVDTASGKRAWSKPLPPRGVDQTQKMRFVSSRVIGKHLVLLQRDEDDAVHGVIRDTRTGNVRWDKKLDLDLQTVPLAVDGTHFYVWRGTLRALRLSDGHDDWAVHPLHDGALFGPPAVVDGVVYALEQGVGLIAVDARSGKRLWAEKDGDAEKADLTSPPAVGARYAYCKRGLDLKAISLASRTAAFTYINAGNRIFVDALRQVIFAVTDDGISGILLQ
ncbi:protein kinase domain-containing protein [Streptomyces odontomachi]|uniref:serine/threonine-protein kinase n=1 Tax=Streptomyces odontomachi TaxID=2944940 RepID=UPI00210B526C|nr:serine/threonine-protein kinase [Streptomyces sp. ODS25]